MLNLQNFDKRLWQNSLSIIILGNINNLTFLLGFNCSSGVPEYPSQTTLSPGTLPLGGSRSSTHSGEQAHMTMA